MTSNPKKGKIALMKSIQKLEPLFERRPNTFLIQIFFDAKVEEIVNLFREGPKVDFKKTENILKKIAPFFGGRWKQIRA
jgi:transcription termination factor Rho